MVMSEDREFAARRRNTLHELYGVQGDRSRKGSVDAPIEVRQDLDSLPPFPLLIFPAPLVNPHSAPCLCVRLAPLS